MPSCLRTAMIGVLLTQTMPLLAQVPTDSQEAPAPLTRFEFLQIRMAIPVRITVYAPDEGTANQAAARAYARFKQLDRLLSDYDPDSELSTLCQEASPGVPRRVSKDLFQVLTAAREFSSLSQGAFDVTVGPLTELWRKARRRHLLPPTEERTSALTHVGWKHVVLDEADRTVDLRLPGMKLDLGGIAKGYAADEALAEMATMGIRRTLIDAGGDVVAGEPPPGEVAWQIGIAPLDKPREMPDRFLQLANSAVATSGDAAQHVEIGGVRYSHIVDPRTGMGVTTLSSVTVLAPDGMTADALASAVSVLGPVGGLELIESLNAVEAYIVTRDAEGRTEVHSSSGLAGDIWTVTD